jgi:hypothetical protein
MSPQEQNKIRNYLLRRIDYSDLKSIIDQNYRYAKNEFDQDYSFHDFNYAIATVIVEDLQIMNHIDLNIDVNNSGLYNDLIDYFYETLKDRTRKLYKHLTEFD